MQYVGRHRAARPIYLRRPVVGGVVLAAVIAVPALALTDQGPGLLGSRQDPSPSSSSSTTKAAIVIPTDAALPSDTRTTTQASTPATSAVVPSTSVAGTTTAGTKPATSSSKPPASSSKPPTSTKPSTSPSPKPPTLQAGLTASDGTVGTVYAGGKASGTGGTKPYRFTVSGALPPGLALNATSGAITGTPTTAGDYSFAVTVTDSGKGTAKQVKTSAKVLVTIEPEADPPAGGAGNA